MVDDEHDSTTGEDRVATLSHLTLSNFRSVAEQSVELDNPTYLVGQNGAGKSNVVDAISFIAEAMSSPLSAVLGRVEAASRKWRTDRPTATPPRSASI